MADQPKNNEEPVVETPGEVVTPQTETTSTPTAPTEKTSLPKLLKGWFSSKGKKGRMILMVVGGLVVLGGVTFAVKPLRYVVQNVFVSPGATILVVDSMSSQPVVGASVTIDGVVVDTNSDGAAVFDSLNYGDQSFTVTKPNYSQLDSSFELSKDQQTYGPYEISPTGSPVTVSLVDWLNKEPINGFSVTDETTNEVIAQVNDSSEAVVYIPFDTEDDLSVLITPNDEMYKSVGFLLNLEEEMYTVEAPLSGDFFFLSNRKNSIGLYKSSLDGTDDSLVEKLTDRDDASVDLSRTNDGKYVVIVAPKKDVRFEGSLLNELYVYDVENNEFTLVDEGPSASFSILGVEEDRVVYEVYFYGDNPIPNRKYKVYKFAEKDIDTIFPDAPERYDNYGRYSIYGVLLPGYILVEETRWTSDSYYSDSDSNYFAMNIYTGEKITLIKGDSGYLYRTDYSENTAYYYSYANSNYYSFNLDNGEKAKIGEDEPITSGQSSNSKHPFTSDVYRADRVDGRPVIIINNDQTIKFSEEVTRVSVQYWLNERLAVLDTNQGSYMLDITTGNYVKITDTYSGANYYYRGGYF